MPLAKIQHPLTRRGHGPGLIIVTEDKLGSSKQGILDPEPVLKWAEEGFAIADVIVGANDTVEMLDGAVNAGVEALHAMDECDDKTKFGIIAYLPSSSPCVSALLRERPGVVGTVFFNFSPQAAAQGPVLAHIPGRAPEQPTKAGSAAKEYFYPAAGEFFVVPGHANYHPASAGLAHTRSLSFLKPLLGGPIFDIEAVWEEHTLYEFGERDVDKTMATMVEQPSINDVPTMTGGVGRDAVSAFYRDHFIFNNPDDVELQLVSRTVGVDRVIDEFVCTLTHDRTLDWILPGVPPTGKKLAVPVTSVIGVRGDRLHNEHISWDQATVLRQLGLLPEYLPFPYPINGKAPSEGRKFEYRLPVAGVEVANKLMDERSVESNTMFAYEAREVPG